MNILLENWFFVLVLLACVAMHFFHGHSHGHGHVSPGADGQEPGSDAKETR